MTETEIVLILIYLLVTIVSVMWAARFFHARRDNFVFATLAVLLAAGLAYGAYWFVNGGPLGWALGFLLMALSYAAVLETTVGAAFGLTLGSFIIQLALMGAVASYWPEKARELGYQYVEPINGKKPDFGGTPPAPAPVVVITPGSAPAPTPVPGGEKGNTP